MIDKPKVGDKVYICYYGANGKPEQTTVERVGRLYFAVTRSSYWRPLEFAMETNVAGYWSRARDFRGYHCYRDVEALARQRAHVEAAKALAVLQNEVFGFFRRWGPIPLRADQWERVAAIIKETQP